MPTTNIQLGLTATFDDNVIATVSGTVFNGPVVAANGLSGSLQTLHDGSPYLQGNGLVNVLTQSNGGVVIDVLNPFTTFVLPSNSITVSQNTASDFYLYEKTLVASSSVLISTEGALTTQELTFWLYDTRYPYTIKNATGSLFTTIPLVPVKLDVAFDGLDWQLSAFKKLAPTQEQQMVQMGLLVDIDPARVDTLTLIGDTVSYVANVIDASFVLTGSGHAPVYKPTGWNSSTPSILFSGSTTYTDTATQYLINSQLSASVYEDVSNTASTFSAWTIFCVYQITDLSSREQTMYSFVDAVNGNNCYLIANSSNFEMAAYFDTSGDVPYGASPSDTGKHVFEVSADGSGTMNFWLDGNVTVSSNTVDNHPRTLNQLLLGATNGSTTITEQFNGHLARFLVFDKNLTNDQRGIVRRLISQTYGITVNS